MFVKTSCFEKCKMKRIVFQLACLLRLQPTMYHEFILLVSRQYANKTTLRMDAFIMYMVVEPCNAHVSCDTLSSHVKVYIC